MNIDLSGLNEMDYTLEFDELSGNATMTFIDPNDPENPLGSMTIETAKYRALIDSLRIVSTEVPEQTFQSELGHVTSYNVRESKVVIKYT